MCRSDLGVRGSCSCFTRCFVSAEGGLGFQQQDRPCRTWGTARTRDKGFSCPVPAFLKGAALGQLCSNGWHCQVLISEVIGV